MPTIHTVPTRAWPMPPTVNGARGPALDMSWV